MMLKSVVLASTLLFVSSSVIAGNQNYSAVVADKKADDKAADKKTADKAILTVSKMTWGGCGQKVERALSKVEGIKSVKTNPSTRLVEIEIADQSKFDLKKAIAAIKADTGWDAVIKKPKKK